MEPNEQFENSARAISRMMGIIFAMFMVVGGFLVYMMIDPTFSAFRPAPEVAAVVAAPEEDDFDKIESLIDENTRALFCESIGNPAGNVVDKILQFPVTQIRNMLRVTTAVVVIRGCREKVLGQGLPENT